MVGPKDKVLTVQVFMEAWSHSSSFQVLIAFYWSRLSLAQPLHVSEKVKPQFQHCWHPYVFAFGAIFELDGHVRLKLVWTVLGWILIMRTLNPSLCIYFFLINLILVIFCFRGVYLYYLKIKITKFTGNKTTLSPKTDFYLFKPTQPNQFPTRQLYHYLFF